MAEKDLAAGSPLQSQFVCDCLPPWYFLHATGGHPGSVCMRQVAKWQRRTLPLATRCKLNLYVTGCRLGTFCMRLEAAICLQLTQILNARGRVCKAAKKIRYSMHQTVLRIRNPVHFFDPWIWDPGCKKTGFGIRDKYLGSFFWDLNNILD
jgi:hypothetical protein